VKERWGQAHYILRKSKNSVDITLYKYRQCNCAEIHQARAEVECVLVSKPFPQVRSPLAGQLLLYSLTLLEQVVSMNYKPTFSDF